VGIDALNITRYPRDAGPYTVTMVVTPPWETVESELRTMDNYEKPILWLHRDRKIGDKDCLAVCGGNGVYHIQVIDDQGRWHEACDPNGSEADVEVWSSDQGFTTKAKFTWPLEKATELIRWYFEHGTRHPDFSWVEP
jgi:hypothetical protein